MAAFRYRERRVRRWWLVGVTLGAASAVAVMLVSGSGASIAATCSTLSELSGSNFEIDQASGAGTKQSPFTGGANLVVNGASPCIDWQSTATGRPCERFELGCEEGQGERLG